MRWDGGGGLTPNTAGLILSLPTERSVTLDSYLTDKLNQILT
jgi:hypothetical protein